MALNNLGNSLWRVGRLDEGTAAVDEAGAIVARYGFTAGIVWHHGEQVYDRDYHGDLDGVLAAAARFLVLGGHRELPAEARAGDAGPRAPGTRPGRRGRRRTPNRPLPASASRSPTRRSSSPILLSPRAASTPPAGVTSRKRCSRRCSQLARTSWR